MVTTVQAIPRSNNGAAGKWRFTAFNRLPSGVSVTVDKWVIECEARETLALLDRYMAAQLVEPLPPLKAVLVHYPDPGDTPTVVQFCCQSPEVWYATEKAWDNVLAKRVQRFKKTLARDELEVVYQRLESRYQSHDPTYYGEEPHWYRQAKLWLEHSR